MAAPLNRSRVGGCLALAALVSGITSLAILARDDEERPTIRRTTYTYKKVGDLELKADVYRPADSALRPVVVWIHGGALIFGSREGVDRQLKEVFLDAGFVLVSIDYRLAPETKLPEIVKDVEDAFRWLHEKGAKLFRADTAKIVVAGGSAGGYLTLTAGFRVKPRPAALVSLWGYGDLVGPWYSSPSDIYRKLPLVSREEALEGVGATDGRVSLANGRKEPKERGEFYVYCRQQGLWPQLVAGFDPKMEPKKFDPYMPVRNVDREYPPTLLIHGTEDTDVPHEQSVLMVRQLERHGVPHRLVTVSGAGHGLSKAGAGEVKAAYASIIPFVLSASTRASSR